MKQLLLFVFIIMSTSIYAQHKVEDNSDVVYELSNWTAPDTARIYVQTVDKKVKYIYVGKAYDLLDMYITNFLPLPKLYYSKRKKIYYYRWKNM